MSYKKKAVSEPHEVDTRCEDVLYDEYEEDVFGDLGIDEELLESVDWDYYEGKQEAEEHRFPEWAHYLPLKECHPCGIDVDGVDIYPVCSLGQFLNRDWENFFADPPFSILLPPFTKRIAYAAGVPARAVLIRKSTMKRNAARYPYTVHSGILTHTLIRATDVIWGGHPDKSLYDFVQQIRQEDVSNATINLDTNNQYAEIVEWKTLRRNHCDTLIRVALEAGGFIHEVPGAERGYYD